MTSISILGALCLFSVAGLIHAESPLTSPPPTTTPPPPTTTPPPPTTTPPPPITIAQPTSAPPPPPAIMIAVPTSPPPPPPIMITLPPSICPDGVNVGDEFVGDGCSICECHHFYISCKGCGMSRAMGMVDFIDETGVYPNCCLKHLVPEKVSLRKTAENQCRQSEELMCVAIQED